MAGARLSRQERLRAEVRGFRTFIEEESERLESGVFDEENEDHVRKRIEEFEGRCEQHLDEIEGDPDQELDEERTEFESVDEYETDEEAREDGYSDADEGNKEKQEEWNEFADWFGNKDARTEVHVVQDLASQGLTKKEFAELAQEYDELVEEAKEMCEDEP